MVDQPVHGDDEDSTNQGCYAPGEGFNIFRSVASTRKLYGIPSNHDGKRYLYTSSDDPKQEERESSSDN